MTAARYLQMPVDHLMELPEVWVDWALTAKSIEIEAETEIIKRARKQ